MPRDTAGRPRPGMFNNIETECGVTLTPVSGRGNYTSYRRSDTGEVVQITSGTKREADFIVCSNPDIFAMFR